MALEKRKSMQHFEVTDDGTIFLKERIEIIENGQVISWTLHRTCFTPLDLVDDVPYQSMKDAAAAVRTEEVKLKFKEKKDKIKADHDKFKPKA